MLRPGRPAARRARADHLPASENDMGIDRAVVRRNSLRQGEPGRGRLPTGQEHNMAAGGPRPATPRPALPGGAGSRRTVAVVGLRRATAFVLLGGLTTALGGE